MHLTLQDLQSQQRAPASRIHQESFSWRFPHVSLTHLRAVTMSRLKRVCEQREESFSNLVIKWWQLQSNEIVVFRKML